MNIEKEVKKVLEFEGKLIFVFSVSESDFGKDYHTIDYSEIEIRKEKDLKYPLTNTENLDIIRKQLNLLDTDFVELITFSTMWHGHPSYQKLRSLIS